MQRYSKIKTGQPREIVLLKGRGCQYKQCTFCDYYQDSSDNPQECARENMKALKQVTGEFGVLEVICSGSFVDLHGMDLLAVMRTCSDKNIEQVIVESHWMYRHQLNAFRDAIAPTKAVFKIGIESFNASVREGLFHKGIPNVHPADIAAYFQQCNLLVGVSGQTLTQCASDIAIGMQYFSRVCVNVFTANSTEMQPDLELIRQLKTQIFSKLRDNPDVDILDENTDFGVGEVASDV